MNQWPFQPYHLNAGASSGASCPKPASDPARKGRASLPEIDDGESGDGADDLSDLGVYIPAGDD